MREKIRKEMNNMKVDFEKDVHKSGQHNAIKQGDDKRRDKGDESNVLQHDGKTKPTRRRKNNRE
eukprot:10009935-Ditylum_brightwellii.AAC.1